MFKKKPENQQKRILSQRIKISRKTGSIGPQVTTSRILVYSILLDQVNTFHMGVSNKWRSVLNIPRYTLVQLCQLKIPPN